ncbi:MAG TPA: hypothetical protein VK581_05720, partial [Chthoniobacterales bacterium]|nr:hypothetical protein [Chthoniobacterales bacterium]
KGLGAGWVALSAGLSEDGIAVLREGVEGRVLARKALGGGTDPPSLKLRRGGGRAACLAVALA